MTHAVLALALGLSLLGAWPAVTSAQSLSLSPEARWETTLVVDARPLQAQVLVDGRPVGLAGELVARAIQVTPGPHTVEISAPGFHRYLGRFTADSRGSVNQFVVTLPPR